MQHPYAEMPNVRMPRACKKGRQYSQQNVRQTRRTRADMQRELLEQQQNAMFNNATSQAQHDYSAYTMSDQRTLRGNNGLQPTGQLHRTTATYTPTSLNQQPTTGPRYNTRGAVHGLATSNASNAERYWHPTISTPPPRPQTPLHRTAPPIQIPVAYPIQNKDISVQTDTEITEQELNLLKSLRERQIDISRFYSIIDRSDYIVTFEENETSDPNNNDAEIVPSNELVSCNAIQQRNDLLTMAYAVDLQRRLAAIMPSANPLPAIEFNSMQNNEPSQSPVATPIHEPPIPACFPHEHQEEFESGLVFAEELAAREISNDNIQLPNPLNTRHSHQQVPPQSFSIPTVMDQGRNSDQMRYHEPNPQAYSVGNFRQNPEVNNIDLLHAAAFVGQYYANQIYQQRPNGYGAFQQRPPWH